MKISKNTILSGFILGIIFQLLWILVLSDYYCYYCLKNSKNITMIIGDSEKNNPLDPNGFKKEYIIHSKGYDTPSTEDIKVIVYNFHYNLTPFEARNKNHYAIKVIQYNGDYIYLTSLTESCEEDLIKYLFSHSKWGQ